jgi:hypothetical protein
MDRVRWKRRNPMSWSLNRSLPFPFFESAQCITASAASAERSEVLGRCKPKLARPSEDDVDPEKNGRESRAPVNLEELHFLRTISGKMRSNGAQSRVINDDRHMRE